MYCCYFIGSNYFIGLPGCRYGKEKATMSTGSYVRHIRIPNTAVSICVYIFLTDIYTPNS